MSRSLLFLVFIYMCVYVNSLAPKGGQIDPYSKEKLFIYSYNE